MWGGGGGGGGVRGIRFSAEDVSGASGEVAREKMAAAGGEEVKQETEEEEKRLLQAIRTTRPDPSRQSGASSSWTRW